MSQQESRSPVTDATFTMGKLHTHPQGRDAVHVAVLQVYSDSDLMPGQHLSIVEENKVEPNPPTTGTTVGIADPYIYRVIPANTSFWMFLYPSMVSSLRHVWSHPTIPDDLDSMEKFR